MIALDIQKDGSEIVPCNRPGFPVHAQRDRLTDYPDASVLSHWHEEVEFVTVLKGTLLHFVNGEERTLPAGDGIFINRGRLHACRSLDGSDCEFICLVLSPSLLGTAESLRTACIEPLCSPEGPCAMALRRGAGWQREVLESLFSLYELVQRGEPGYELKVLSLFCDVWRALLAHRADEEAPVENRHMEDLCRMMAYIRSHWAAKPSLEEIAAAGALSKSGCCALFREVLGESPISYLIRYRLEKSIELLRDDSLSITRIALGCGFCSSSYYTELFRRRLGCTPSQYRALHRDA